MRKLAGMQPGQDFRLTIPRIEEPVRFQHDISRTRHDPEEEVRSVAARNGRYGSKGADVLPIEDQGIPRSGPDFLPSSKRVDHESRVALPTLRLHDEDGALVRLEGEGLPIESDTGEGEREEDRPRARVRIRRQKEEEDNRLTSRFRKDRPIFHGESRRAVD